jgi:hypothetical protein
VSLELPVAEKADNGRPEAATVPITAVINWRLLNSLFVVLLLMVTSFTKMVPGGIRITLRK